jgi:DNA-binding MarR family transcriptional regulator
MGRITLNHNTLVGKSQWLEEREVEVVSLKPFFADFDLVPVFSKLQGLPPLVCATTSEGDFVVFHESIWRVLLDSGVKTVKALFFKGVWREEELFYLREKLFRRRKKALVRFLFFAYKNFYGEDFYKNRAQVIQAISQKAGITTPTVYAYLWKHLKEEKRNLKRRAEELYKEGITQMEIAKLLGVPQRTISDWVKKGEEEGVGEHHRRR